MRKYYVYACESFYSGLHGYEQEEVVEAHDIRGACEIGEEMSDEIILEVNENEIFEDEDYILESEKLYEVYTIKEKYQSLSKEELNEKLKELGKEEFIEDYCDMV